MISIADEIKCLLETIPFSLTDAINLDSRIRTQRYKGETLTIQDNKLWARLSEEIGKHITHQEVDPK